MLRRRDGDAPHLVPKTVTGCEAGGVQCTRPSLMGNPWGFFTFGAGVESQTLTYDGEVSQPPYLLALPLQSPSTKGLEL